MCAVRRPDFDVIKQPAGEPIVLAGPPGALFGEVLLHNPGGEKVVLRDARLSGLELRSFTGPPAEETRLKAALPESAALSSIVLRPGQQRSLPIQMSLNPHTPPGEYHAQLEAGGRTRDVVIHVTEFVLLDISPDELVLENVPDASYTKRVVFTNRGNTPLQIGDIGAVPLDDERFDCRMLRAALEAVGDETHPLEEYVAEIARQSREILQKAGHLRVRNTTGPFELQPGEVRPVDLELHIPASLERRTRYTGAAAIYTNDLNFVIVPAQGQAKGTSSKEKPPARRARKGGESESNR